MNYVQKLDACKLCLGYKIVKKIIIIPYLFFPMKITIISRVCSNDSFDSQEEDN
jgi:hypothetical protein